MSKGRIHGDKDPAGVVEPIPWDFLSHDTDHDLLVLR